MRVVVTSIGSFGDVNPFMAVALALEARGHQVLMLANPYFQKHIEGAGLDFRPLGEPIDLRQIAEMPDLMHHRKALKLTLQHLLLPNIPVIMEAVGDLISNWHPDIVLGGHTSHGARWMCESKDVPYAGAVLSPLLWLSPTDPSIFMSWEPEQPPRWYRRWRRRAAKLIIAAYVNRPFNKIRRAHGLATERGLYLADVCGGVVNLALWSKHFRGPWPGDPPNSVICGFPWFDRDPQLEDPLDKLDAFLDDGEPPIVFTLGTAAVHIPGDFFRVAAETCRLLGRRGLLLTRHAEFAPSDLPPEVRAFSYAPFSKLLPRGCATVHHGGVGTTAQAMRAGRPTVIVPFSHDQFDNAARAKRLGVSATVKRPKASPDGLAAVLRSVLENPEVTQRAKSLGSELAAEDGAVRAAQILEETIQGTVSPQRAAQAV